MSNKRKNEIPEWVNDAVDRDSTLDEMIDSFINSKEEFWVDRRVIAMYRKITGKPEIIDLVRLSDEEMIEKYGSSDIKLLTQLRNDKRWVKFNVKITALRDSELPVERADVESLLEELKLQGPFRTE